MYAISFWIAGLIFCGSTPIYAQANAVARDPDFNYYVHSQERETPPKASSFLNTLTPSRQSEEQAPRTDNELQAKRAADHAWAQYKTMKGQSKGNTSIDFPSIQKVERPTKPNTPNVQKTIARDMGGVIPQDENQKKRPTSNSNIADMLKRYREKQTNDTPLNTVTIKK